MGATHTAVMDLHKTVCFNSRTRVGATSQGREDPRYWAVSIHAPVWVRLVEFAEECNKNPFQFTHPCGCDTYGWLCVV